MVAPSRNSKCYAQEFHQNSRRVIWKSVFKNHIGFSVSVAMRCLRAWWDGRRRSRSSSGRCDLLLCAARQWAEPCRGNSNGPCGQSRNSLVFQQNIVVFLFGILSFFQDLACVFSLGLKVLWRVLLPKPPLRGGPLRHRRRFVLRSRGQTPSFQNHFSTVTLFRHTFTVEHQPGGSKMSAMASDGATLDCFLNKPMALSTVCPGVVEPCGWIVQLSL